MVAARSETGNGLSPNKLSFYGAYADRYSGGRLLLRTDGK